MAMKQLIANKDFSYMTRRLKAGESFECKARDVKVLTGIKLAREPRQMGSIPPPPASLKARLPQLDHDGKGGPGGSTGAVDHMRALRAEYHDVTGKRPFSGWNEAELRRRMAEAGK